jgi:hypothetical protein
MDTGHSLCGSTYQLRHCARGQRICPLACLVLFATLGGLLEEAYGALRPSTSCSTPHGFLKIKITLNNLKMVRILLISFLK